MREAVRQILRIVPLLFVVSVIAFALVSLGLTQRGLRSRAAELPLFINPEPQDVRRLSQFLMNAVTRGNTQGSAEARLAELGGAALPFILPQFDSLSPKGRERVAHALFPVAQRMGILGSSFEDRAAAVPAFWQRYWQERSIDFRPVVVRRLVERLAARDSPLSQRDLIQLDTYCLAELLSRIGSVNSPADVGRVARISTVLAHITDKNWVIPADADVTLARALSKNWQGWWSRQRSQYVPLDGPLRIIALVAETQYGQWLAGVVRHGLGSDSEGQPIVSLILNKAPTTLALVLPALLFAYGFAPRLTPRLQLLRRPFRVSLLAVALLPVSLPVVVFFSDNERHAGPLWAATLLMLTWVTAPVLWHMLAPETATAPVPSETRPLFASELPGILSLALVVETLFGLDGLGRMLVLALKTGDRNLVVVFALMGFLLSALLRAGNTIGTHRKRPQPRLLVVRDSSPEMFP